MLFPKALWLRLCQEPVDRGAEKKSAGMLKVNIIPFQVSMPMISGMHGSIL
jgi:hypothetical protein